MLNTIAKFLFLSLRITYSIKQIGLKNTLTVFSYILGYNNKTNILLNGKKFFFHPRSDKGVMSHFYSKGYKITGDIKLIFDIGANIGDETARFLHFHPDAVILSIEASSRNFKLLKENCKWNQNVKLINRALWINNNFLNLSKNETEESYSIYNNFEDEFNSVEMVQGITMQELLDDLPGSPSIDVLKIDIEGAEEAIFCLGNVNWLKRVNCIIMEIPDNNNPGALQKISQKLAFLGIKGSTFLSGENIVFIKENSGFSLSYVQGLGR